MRLIPGKTKVQIELFRGVTLWDILVGAIALVLIILVIISSLPRKLAFCIAIGFITVLLVIRLDEKPNYLLVLHMFRHFSSPRRFGKVYDDEMLKKKAQNEVVEEYLEKYKEDVRRQEEEIDRDPDSEFYEEEMLSEGETLTYYDEDESVEYDEEEDPESEDYDVDITDEEIDGIHFVDDPEYTDDLDSIQNKKNSSKPKKKGSYSIVFGKKDENGEG